VRVDRAWHDARPAPPGGEPGPSPAARAPTGETVATVNGAPIERSRIVDLLLAGHGPGILEQLVVLESARRLAADRSITVTEADIQAEYTRSLETLTAPLLSGEPEALDRKAGEALLNDVLSRRNISRAEYRIGMERNAYLRKLVQGQLRITEEQLRAEFDRTYGRRVQVRHMELPGLPAAHEVRRLLDTGADFADLARRMSTNADTSRNGGLMPPFPETDPDVPALLREVAFALKDGEVSNPVRVGTNCHILRRERILDAVPVSMETVRQELQKCLLDRLTAPAMRQLYRTLYEQADIVIYDPVLREAVDKRLAGADKSNNAAPE
jgi:parvulin-like peptidyl-prolyl isomerase